MSPTAAGVTEVTIHNDLDDATDEKGMSPIGVFINSTHGYAVYNTGDRDLVYRKTTDGGANWGSEQTLIVGSYFSPAGKKRI